MDSSPLIAGLELLFRRYNITTVDELAMLLRQDGNGVADYITSSDNRQAAYKQGVIRYHPVQCRKKGERLAKKMSALGQND